MAGRQCMFFTGLIDWELIVEDNSVGDVERGATSVFSRGYFGITWDGEQVDGFS